MPGLLGDIFSAGNVARRKLTDLLGNPVLSAQQIVGNLNDRARVLNEMTSAAAQEGVNYGPASRQLAGLLAEAYNPIGMVVYHGSPAKFSRFDPTKIGSGEGAQAYGYGHYVAEAPGVATEYQKKLSDSKFVSSSGKDLKDMPSSGGFAPMMNEMKKNGKTDLEIAETLRKISEGTHPYAKNAKSLADKLESGKLSYETGNLYEIDLPDEQIAKMLDWDKPLSKQPENVQAALEKLGYKVDRADVDKYSDALLDALMTDAQTNLPKQPLDMAGEALYRKLGNPEQAAQRLREAGIPGIRYLDQGSRGAGEGTSNFVVFPGNEDMLTILKRNGGLLGP